MRVPFQNDLIKIMLLNITVLNTNYHFQTQGGAGILESLQLKYSSIRVTPKAETKKNNQIHKKRGLLSP